VADNNIAWFAGLIITMIAAAIYVILLMPEITARSSGEHED